MAAADRIISRLDPLQLSAPLRFPTVRLRDPNDEHVAAFALTADANAILSQDLDLLSVREVDGIPIMGVQMFAYTLGIRH